MLSKDCQECKYCIWGVGLGIGVRCINKANQKYKSEEAQAAQPNAPVMISYVPENCTYFEQKVDDKE